MANYITRANDSRIPEGIKVKTLKSGKVSYKEWFLPLNYGDLTLSEANQFLKIVAAPQGKIPEIIRWTEGKDSHLVKQFFYGGVDLQAHDFVHILLGRGLLPKDEAFVIGFTMGSTNKLATMNKEVFAHIAEHYYPNAYHMDAESRTVYMDAAKLGYVSDCEPLDTVNFEPLLDLRIDEVRKKLNLHPRMIEAYYAEIEMRRHPEDPASSRLLEVDSNHNPWFFPDELNSKVSFYDAAMESKQRLRATDIAYTLDQAVFEHALAAAKANIDAVLDNQNEIAKMCFEEIKKVCGENEAHVKRDHESRTWDHFFNQAHESVTFSYEKVKAEIGSHYWETEDDAVVRRAYVHTLLNRGTSQLDRAFCRGFYDGSSNKKSTYAADMKASVFAEVVMTLDGLYSPQMKQVYLDGVRLGYVSDCTPLCQVDFTNYKDLSVSEVRKQTNLTTSMLYHYQQEIEEKR